MANTKSPEPVSSVTAAARLALDGVARKVATPVPSPDTPVDIGRPVQLVRVPADGVPMFGVVSIGDVRVLLVNVWLPVNVATVLSMAIVTGAVPLKDVPLRPVPIVSVLIEKGIVSDPPRDTGLPLIVMDELVSEAFPMFDRVFVDPLMLLFVSVSVVALPTKVSVAAGSVRVPEAAAADCRVVVPDEDPTNTTPVASNSAVSLRLVNTSLTAAPEPAPSR